MENHSWMQQPSYPVIDTQNYPPRQDDFFNEMKSMNLNNSPSMNRMMPTTGGTMSNSLVNISPSPSEAQLNAETLKQLSMGFNKMMTLLERLEQRIQRVEQTTAQILKNQQETFQVPFMSQAEIDQARQAAELLERDSSVAKQLQAAYNKETEVRKSMATVSQSLVECPICGVRVNGFDIEAHVDQCLEMFSNDPKKETQVQDTKKKMDQGFFSRFMKTSASKKTEKTETTTTKVVTTSTSSGKSEASAPLLGNDSLSPNNAYFPPHMPFAYPPAFTANGQPQQHPPMMMPMYMYPSYPATHMTTNLQE